MAYPLFNAGWKFNQVADQDIWEAIWLIVRVVRVLHNEIAIKGYGY